ncbi:beta-ketoacyl synthase N-terminal-like domain-containing protein [Streptomyces sp. H10-C2]|uniref:beta-ketoacyl-[acyl-carrier-protein] synthase family protein n=1 Tax=unclassified Streptomyces TaxID=2593676 RepID=UPI0024BA7956|nr:MULTISPECIES: beta-ketoacyl synthase N-terminal-like domain-containing protein [unclassified Streptomyces]MDJ0346551.1 beta-ketoacyl synthase N-terminal-like domain-containing protein [Streptomyces sp. PH10-H1]MDJ0374356.1 beta-ketoacyl synthase N-terminal-like domain-containing protein [Streptomyces sp. H10-C2]
MVITGLGAISRLGNSAAELWEGLLLATGKPTPAPEDCGLSRRPPVYQVSGTAQERSEWDGRLIGRASVMACHAVGEALSDAGLGREQCADAGLTVGTTLGDIDLAEAGSAPGVAAGSGSFRVASAIAGRYGLGGPNQSLSTACSAGAYAVSWAAELIDSGQADVVIACGTDGYSRVALASLDRFGLLDHLVCRPFDAGRQGMVTGDGAAAVVLESAAHAARRGAVPYAVVESYGWSCDGYHPTAPEPGGAQLGRAVAEALNRASGPPGALVLHRAGITVNDIVESNVVAAALGERVDRTPALGIKAVIGHTAGAAGVFGCVTAALILRHRTVPPNAHVATLDPDCPLDVPVAGPVPLTEPRVLVSATGFGGNNAVLVLGAAS